MFGFNHSFFVKETDTSRIQEPPPGDEHSIETSRSVETRLQMWLASNSEFNDFKAGKF